MSNEVPTEIRPLSDDARQAMAALAHAAAVVIQHALGDDLKGSEFVAAYKADKARLVVEIALPDHAMTIWGEWPEFHKDRFQLTRLVPGKLRHDA